MPTLLLLLLFFFFLKLEKWFFMHKRLLYILGKGSTLYEIECFLETPKHDGPSLKYISAGHKQIM